MKEWKRAIRIIIFCVAFSIGCATYYHWNETAKQFQANQFKKIENMLDLSGNF